MTAGPDERRDAAPTRPIAATEAERREARLAEALRANLRRRKEQAHKRGTADTPSSEVAPPVAAERDRP